MDLDPNQKKVIIYNTSFFSVSETFIYNQVMALSEDNEIYLVASNFLNPHNYDLNSFKKYEVQRSRGFMNSLSEKFFNTRLFDFRSYKSLYHLFKDNEYKAVHAHYGTNAIEILPLAKWFQVPLVVSFHGADASRTLRNKRYREKLPELFEYASAVIVSSRHMLENLGLNEMRSKVHVIPYGVNLSNFPYCKKKKSSNEKIKILHVGRIVGKKGVPDLIEVFRMLLDQYNNLELHLAGDGDEISKCQALVEKYDLEHKVIFYGSVTHDKVKSLLQESDIYVLNSRTDEQGDMEGTPNTILEAMSMGKAVVSTRHAGIPFVVEHESNGLLADEYDNKDLKNSIDRLIKDPGLRKRIGSEARKTIEERYTVQLMKDNLRQVFRDL